ncbi:TPM domain-containing protein [Bergeriella denitrificans]|uniref:Domain of uncharacterized function (DUF477) n=1 Tax=Bergeriella denitrificans TaxID=494 RepID=A0A378UGA1_BERDE|nr:TPM domain-containing protein [Bergeriella denitrificans]STZ76404.1 Domain of uncharacterised function (DUF477) [Bergeriella denitrificans]
MNTDKWKRLWRHWLHPRCRVEKWFPEAALQHLSAAVARSEQNHGGQIRFVVEACYRSGDILAGISPHTRALQWFERLEMGNTADGSGVLIYVSAADRAVEIIADKGISGKISAQEWQQVCKAMCAAFRHQRYTEGLAEGLRLSDALLAAAFPVQGEKRNELADEVVLV